MAVYSPTMNVMIRAARKVGRNLVRDFGEVEQLQVSRKGPADFVSTADQAAERKLKQELGKARPDFGFLMEEGTRVDSKDSEGRRWIVDPLDGTTNFLHGIPHFAISIAVEAKGQITAGVVYNPVTDELFWAERNAGAYLNDRRLRVSGRSRFEDSLLATGLPFMGHGDSTLSLRELNAIMPSVAGIRRFGAAALDLAWVAAGRYDAFWERGLNPWDVAAGILLVREAGGFVSEIGLGENPLEKGTIVAGNSKIHGQLAKRLGEVERDHRKAKAAAG